MIPLRCSLLGSLVVLAFAQEESPWASHWQAPKPHDRSHDTSLYKELAVVARANSDKRFLSSDLEKDGNDIAELSAEAEKSMAQQHRQQQRFAEEERARKPLEQIRRSVEQGMSEDGRVQGFLGSPAPAPTPTWREGDSAQAAEKSHSVSWSSLNQDISAHTRLSPLEDAAQQIQDAQTALAESHSEQSKRSDPLPEAPMPELSHSGYSVRVDPRRVQRLLKAVQ